MFKGSDYPRYAVSLRDPHDIRPDDIQPVLDELRSIRPSALKFRPCGESAEGREISSVSLGTGPRKVLAWSQMHGDEPTHTAVLLDLLNFLQRAPEHPCAKAILTGCTLELILMLNPDGAQRGTRRNAQGIDINRDALALQSPEGRILREAVEAFRPDFAFNLHNHNPRTTVGQTQKVAAASLLVPSIDPQATETPEVLQAKQLASCFCSAVEPHAPGMIARYSADFMPRAFGEWVQQQGVATLLIEAGGWSKLDATPLRQLHFFGLIQTLYQLATDRYAEADRSIYESLHHTGDHDLFDLLLRGATIVNGLNQAPFVADVGINQPTRRLRTNEIEWAGVLEDLGDLRVTTGKSIVDAQQMLCLTGQIALVPEVTPARLPDEKTTGELLALGITSVIGQVDLADSLELDTLENLAQRPNLPINIGFVVLGESLAQMSTDMQQDKLQRAIVCGILAVVADELPDELAGELRRLNLPRLTHGELLSASPKPMKPVEMSIATSDAAKLLQLVGRGMVGLRAAADLMLVQNISNSDIEQVIDWSDLQQVFVGGAMVFDRGTIVESSAGIFLKR